jgi:hypothetical protein
MLVIVSFLFLTNVSTGGLMKFELLSSNNPVVGGRGGSGGDFSSSSTVVASMENNISIIFEIHGRNYYHNYHIQIESFQI